MSEPWYDEWRLVAKELERTALELEATKQQLAEQSAELARLRGIEQLWNTAVEAEGSDWANEILAAYELEAAEAAKEEERGT